MKITRVIQIIRQWMGRHSYAAAVIGTLTIVALLVSTGGLVGGLQQARLARQERLENRRLAQQAAKYVWCIVTFTTEKPHKEASWTYGHFAGHPIREVLRWEMSSTWLLAQHQQTDCYRNWTQAAKATAQIAETAPEILSGTWAMPHRRASEDEVRRAVLAAWLDHPPSSYRSNGLKATEETPDRWCMSHLRNIDHTVYHLPHALGGREAVEAVLDQLPDRSHLMQYRIDETACFASKGDAQNWLHKQKFVPPTDTTITTYLDTVSVWLVGEEG